MKLSIVVPVYNCENYIDKCIVSLLNQTIKDYEIILINDGSTDNSANVIQKYVNDFPDVVRFLTVDNGGQGRARNIGIDISKGDYIGFVDSDDYVASDMYEKLIDAAEISNADIVCCDFIRFEGDRFKYEKSGLQDNYLSCAGAVWNKIFKKSLLDDIRFPEGLWYEDLEFSAKALIRSAKTSFISEGLYYYRSDNTSTMRNNNGTKNLDILKVFDHIYEFVSTERSEDMNFLVINHILLDSIKRVNEIGDRKVVKELREYVKCKIPNLNQCTSYKLETKNRRLIMKLNYIGLDGISNLLLKLKA